MPVLLDVEVFLRLLKEAKEWKEQERLRYSYHGDVVKIHLALGGEIVVDELRRKLTWQLEAMERIREQEEQKKRTRELRRRQRELAKHPEVVPIQAKG